jgi:H+-transporting ATPase
MKSRSDRPETAGAEKKLIPYGPNEIADETGNAFLKFLGCFWGPIPRMIETAVIFLGLDRHREREPEVLL